MQLKGQAIIREQREDEVKFYLSALLTRLAKLYQIPGWDADGAVILAEWIMETYATEALDLVARTLANPPISTDKNWRLTPDTISGWMEGAIEREIEKRERAHKAILPGTGESEWTDERLNEWMRLIESVETKISAPPMTEEEVRKEGQEKPLKKHTPYTPREYEEEVNLRTQWMRECTDIYTGRMKEGAPDFETWIKLKPTQK